MLVSWHSQYWEARDHAQTRMTSKQDRVCRSAREDGTTSTGECILFCSLLQLADPQDRQTADVSLSPLAQAARWIIYCSPSGRDRRSSIILCMLHLPNSWHCVTRAF